MRIEPDFETCCASKVERISSKLVRLATHFINNFFFFFAGNGVTYCKWTDRCENDWFGQSFSYRNAWLHERAQYDYRRCWFMVHFIRFFKNIVSALTTHPNVDEGIHFSADDLRAFSFQISHIFTAKFWLPQGGFSCQLKGGIYTTGNVPLRHVPWGIYRGGACPNLKIP